MFAAILLAAVCESFFGVDGALSWTEKDRFRVPEEYHGDMYHAAVDYLAESGVHRLRDRLAWDAIEKSKGVVSFDGLSLDVIANYCKTQNISICVCLDHPPKWLNGHQPDDLAAVYQTGKKIAEHYSGLINNWEIMNERDQTGNEASWEYSSTAKAFALGFRAGNPDVRLMPTSICLPKRGPFERGMYANDIGYYFDVFNYHIYTGPCTHGRNFAALRDFLKDSGVPDVAVSVTEEGCDIEGATEAESCIKGIGMHSPRQADIQAEYYVKNQISLMMHGVSDAYFFFFGALEERAHRKDWGMIRRDGTKKPVYFAMQHLVQRVGKAVLEGEVKVGEGERGYLFRQPDGSSTLVKWKLSSIDTGIGSLYGEPDDREIKYYDYPEEKEFEIVKKPFPVGKTGPLDPQGRDLSIVYALDFATNDFSVTGGKSTLELKGKNGKLKLSTWNLSHIAKKGKVNATGGKITGVPDGEFEIGAFTNVSWTVEFTPDGWTTPEGRLEVTGEFDGHSTSKMSVPMICCADEFLENADVFAPETNDPRLWVTNSNAVTDEIIWNESEKALEFHLVFDPANGDKWFYPIFKVPQGSLDGAVIAVFEVKSVQDKIENDYNHANFMIGPWLKYDPPMKVWETRRVSLAGIDLKDCVQFQIGAGPRGNEVRMFIRNLRFIKCKKSRDGFVCPLP